MDSELTQAKRRWKQTGERAPFIRALHKMGQDDLVDQLVALYVPEACFIKYDYDFITYMEESSDHIDGICPCPDCITLEQFYDRLGGKKSPLWGKFVEIFKGLVLAEKEKGRGMLQKMAGATYLDHLHLNTVARRNTLKVLADNLLEAA